MKILTNKKQIELMVAIKKLNIMLVNSNIDWKAYDLLADIGCSVLDMKHLLMLHQILITKELEK